MTLIVSSKVRFMCIFSGVFWRGDVKWESGRRLVVNVDFRFFRSLYLPNLHTQGHNYCIVLCSPLVAVHWHQNGWPWITFNSHFALKSVSGSVSNGLVIWRFGVRRKLLGNLQSYAYNVSGNKNVAQRVYCWYKCYGVIRWFFPKRKRQISELYSHSQFSRMPFTLIMSVEK